MTEFELIERLKPTLPRNAFVVAGAGDDCALLDLGAPTTLLTFKTDAVVEGVHFESTEEPERIGHKALGRCLSDLAAMGAAPVAALVTLGLPRSYDPERVIGVYRGLNRLAGRWQTAVVGGEVTTNPVWMISVAVVGQAPRQGAVRRSGAKLGDAIFVTGELGGSRASRHLDFEPRLTEGQWLAAGGWATAMIDLSDGLSGDLPHILTASGGLGAQIRADSVPISLAARRRGAVDPGHPPLLAALADGEDFELLFTVPPARAVALLDAWRAEFPAVRLTCIGRTDDKPGVRVQDRTGVRSLPAAGYEHHTDPRP